MKASALLTPEEKRLRDLACKIAGDLFTGGSGDLADRLVLVRDDSGRDLGGWALGPAVEIIFRRLRGEAVSGPTREYCAELAAFLRDCAVEDERCEYPQSAGRFRAAADLLDRYPLPAGEGERADPLTTTARGLAAHELVCVQVHNAAIEAAALIVCPEPHVEEEVECSEVARRIRGLKRLYRSAEIEAMFARRETLADMRLRSAAEDRELEALRARIGQLPTARSPADQEAADEIRRAVALLRAPAAEPAQDGEREALATWLRGLGEQPQFRRAAHLMLHPAAGVDRKAVLSVLTEERRTAAAIEFATPHGMEAGAVRVAEAASVQHRRLMDLAFDEACDRVRALPETESGGGWHYLPDLPPEPSEGEEVWLDIWRYYPHKPELRPVRDEVPWRGDAIDGPQFLFRHGFATYCWRRAQHEPPPIPAREGQE